MDWKIHNLAPDHKRSRNNPGDAMPTIPDASLAYRTARCGVVRYCKLAFGVYWMWQDNETVYCSDIASDVTCKTCQRRMSR